MKRELSILIPVYNAVCMPLVERMHGLAETVEGLRFEVIAAEDGSTDRAAIAANQQRETLPCYRHIERKTNKGRSAIRNFLAGEAQYEWLLFLDCDMTIRHDDFLLRYLACEADEVIDGGISVGKGSTQNLRYLYEKEAEQRHSAEERRMRPYQDFHTANFLIRRDLMVAYPFDERFRHYGYEDVFFGKQLKEHRVKIAHIDNPAGFDTFEDNAHFVSKTEEGLHTLHEFRNELRGYNRLLTFVGGIHLGLVRGMISLWHRLFGRFERRLLCSSHPNLTVFKLYKLGYYLQIK